MRLSLNLKSLGAICVFSTLMVVACEEVKNDVLPETAIEELSPQKLYSIPGEPVVIDLLEGVTSTEPMVMKVKMQPDAGDLELLAETLASYEIEAGSRSSADTFTIEMRTANATYEKDFQVQVTTRANYPLSENGAVYDRGGILKPGESIIADVLANDAEGAMDLEIELEPQFGEASVTEDQKIAYTADEQYLGLVDLIYKVNFPSGRTGRAIVRFAISE